jgi:hypothetical protein
MKPVIFEILSGNFSFTAPVIPREARGERSGRENLRYKHTPILPGPGASSFLLSNTELIFLRYFRES